MTVVQKDEFRPSISPEPIHRSFWNFEHFNAPISSLGFSSLIGNGSANLEIQISDFGVPAMEKEWRRKKKKKKKKWQRPRAITISDFVIIITYSESPWWVEVPFEVCFKKCWILKWKRNGNFAAVVYLRHPVRNYSHPGSASGYGEAAFS